MNTDALLSFDREHILHPYTSPTQPLPVYPVVAANGVRLQLADGRTLVDGMASWWCVIHGYNHPKLNRAIHEQLEKMAHVMFGGLTHPQAVMLAQKLLALVPSRLQKVFFCDSGSVSVEVALKMAVQYWYSLGNPAKNRMVTIRNGYHGDTFGAMSVCDPDTGMHHIFSGVVRQQFFAEAPLSRTDAEWDASDFTSMQDILAKHHQEVAAVILEPIVQGAGGMRFYAPEYLRRVRALCDHYGVLLIFDEIATGFGRTGKMFAMEHAGVVPDILCLGKSITGGYMSFAATLTTSEICEAIGSKEPGVFMHGPTYMANPLACAVANASIDLLLAGDMPATIARLEAGLKNGLHACAGLAAVKEVRTLGAIGVVEMKRPLDLARFQEECVKRGVWVRPFGRLVYLMPPYIIDETDLSFLTDQVCDVITAVT